MLPRMEDQPVTAGVHLTPDAVYDDGALYCALGLTAAALARARRSGQLRYTRQGNRILYLGQWVVSWLRASAEPREEVPSVTR
jgi:hypothetical protein